LVIQSLVYPSDHASECPDLIEVLVETRFNQVTSIPAGPTPLTVTFMVLAVKAIKGPRE